MKTPLQIMLSTKIIATAKIPPKLQKKVEGFLSEQFQRRVSLQLGCSMDIDILDVIALDPFVSKPLLILFNQLQQQLPGGIDEIVLKA